jgi:hypothetical protein
MLPSTSPTPGELVVGGKIGGREPRAAARVLAEHDQHPERGLGLPPDVAWAWTVKSFSLYAPCIFHYGWSIQTKTGGA